jgi:hypothetical protein
MPSAASEIRVRRDESGRLVYRDRLGREHAGVEPVRAFPLSDPERLITLLDSHGRELLTIDNLADLPAESRQAIAAELADRQFLPRIERVVRVQDAKEPEIWDVVTDRGPVRFLLGDSEEIRRLGPHRAILLDVHGGRYFISDSRQLDARSQHILTRYL